jgi:transposase
LYWRSLPTKIVSTGSRSNVCFSSDNGVRATTELRQYRLAFVAAIDDPRLGAYLGLVPRRYQSGEVDYVGTP